MLSHAEFVNNCAAQNVRLYGGFSNTDIGPLQASYTMGINVKLGITLADNPIVDTSFCTDPISAAHAAMINTAQGQPMEVPLRTARRDKAVTGCIDAEARLGDWFAGLSRGRKVGGWIITDAQRNPVAIKKEQLRGRPSSFYGESSALLLQDVMTLGTSRTGTAQHIVAPRGSLVSMQLSNKARGTRNKDDLTTVVDFSEVEAILFTRMTGIELHNDDWETFYAEEEDVVRPTTMHFPTALDIVTTALARPEMQKQFAS